MSRDGQNCTLNEVKKTRELSTENVRFILDTLLERYFRDTK